MVIAALLLGLQRQPVALTLEVDGKARQAVVFPGSAALQKPSPIVFLFHGRGSSAIEAAGYGIQMTWPEATVVIPKGLEGNDGRAGWQRNPGENGDNDIKFVDAILSTMKQKFKMPSKGTYACGISNGAMFSFVLFRSRANTFAGFASVAGVAGEWLKKITTPKPWLLIHGKNDTLMPLKGLETTRAFLANLNGCAAKPVKWSAGYQKYPSKTGNDVIVAVHSGGHMWPDGASEAIVKFFKEQYKKTRP